MANLLMTTGRIAEHPYRLRLIDRNIYTIEELCYSLAQCASFLDDDLMDHELLTWIEEECALPELAAQLRSILRGRCTVEDFVAVLLLYVGYQTPAQIEEIRQSISGSKGMEPFQRRRSEAKFCAREGHVTQAIELLDSILNELPDLEREMRGRIWADKGLLYVKGFRYAEAADCYGRAWRLCRRKQYGISYLAALRFAISDEEFEAYLEEHPELEETAMALDEKAREAGRAYRSGSAARQVKRLQGYLGDGQIRNFDKYARERVRDLQDEFRRDNMPSF